MTVNVENTVTCQKECGMLGEHLTFADGERLVNKHVRQTGHPTQISGLPVPTRDRRTANGSGHSD